MSYGLQLQAQRLLRVAVEFVVKFLCEFCRVLMGSVVCSAHGGRGSRRLGTLNSTWSALGLWGRLPHSASG